MGMGDLDSYIKTMKLDHQDLNISCNTIKVLEEIIGSKISDILCYNIFANISPRAREME